MAFSDDDGHLRSTRNKPGRPRTGHYLSLREAGENYIKWLILKRRKHRTILTMTGRIRTLEKCLGWEFDMRYLDQESIVSFIEKRTAQGIASSSINMELTVLNMLVKRAVMEDRIAPSRITALMGTFKLPEEKILPEGLKDSEIRALLSSAALGLRPERTTLIILIALHAGLRHREICNLKRVSIDLSEKFIQVASWTTKARRERRVAIPDELVNALERYLENMEDKSPAAWLFPGAGDKGIDNVFDDVSNAFKQAGLYYSKTRPGLHSLRKTWATRMAKSGVDMPTLRSMAGWRNLKTAEPYFEERDDIKREAVDRAYGKLKISSAPAVKNAGVIDLSEFDGLVAAGMPEAAALKYLREKAKN